ncbi:MAG: 30S ribosomal protein S12 methylthiotransferase RimO, partial [Elusimicrobia bacterium CG11_big_fil_rev_8_21_14_0_20_64_6]
RLGVFQYSHEENTHAYSLADDVPAAEKKRRAEAVMAAQQPISLAVNASRIGKVVKVLVDRKEARYFVGRTEQDSPEVDNEVLIGAESQYLRVGDFADIKITGAEEYDLVGEAV